MKVRNATLALACGFFLLVPGGWAADPPAPAQGDDAATQLQRLKAQLEAQQKQIEQLRTRLETQEKLLEKTAASAGPAAPAGAAPAADPTHRPASLGEVASTVPIIPPGIAAAAASPLPAPQQNALPTVASPAPASPLQIHIGGATITPVGFMDLTNTWRSTNSGASLATNFASLPYDTTPQSHLSEDRFSAQNSRLGIRVDADFKGAHVLGYMEGDFVGFAPTNSQVTSNSMTYRLRLYWVNVRKNIWEFQAGQSWSLLTPNRVGLSALPGDLFYGQEFDVNYLNGLTWGRIPGVRFIVHPNRVISAGISLESAEQYIGGSGGAPTPVLPAAFAASNFFNEVDNGSTTTAVPNVHPDVIAKIAFDTKVAGKQWHFEVAGLERTFKTYNPTTAQYFTKAGGGASVNMGLEVAKNFRLFTNNFWSDGGGRYLFGIVPDMIIRANGSPSLIHTGSTLDGFEWQMHNSMIYGYYGGIYAQRNTALDANGSPIGYGFPGAPIAQNRTTQEITGGLTQTLWKDPRYGALQVFLQYAYFTRNPWMAPIAGPKMAMQHAAWFNFRYVLPGSAPTIEQPTGLK